MGNIIFKKVRKSYEYNEEPVIRHWSFIVFFDNCIKSLWKFIKTQGYEVKIEIPKASEVLAELYVDFDNACLTKENKEDGRNGNIVLTVTGDY